MNIALGAIILVILLLPGAIAINSYYSSFIAKQARVAIPFNELLLKGIFISFIIHSCTICVLRYGFNKDIKLLLLYQIVIGKELVVTDEYFTNKFLQFCLYSAILVLGAWASAKAVKRIVQINNFDLNYYSLRSMNYWYIVFSARYLEGRGIQGRQANTDFVFLDVLTTENIIYSGILIDFNYSPQKDQLENVILDSTVKRSFHQSTEDAEANKIHSTGKPYEIPGDAFIIPNEKILNINIYYIEIEGDPLPTAPKTNQLEIGFM